MARSVVTEALSYPCPSCGVDSGVKCWPWAVDDANWCHKFRVELMLMNQRMAKQGPLRQSIVVQM